jgi:hypothetical protein
LFESFLSIFMLFLLLHIIILLNPSSFAIFFSWTPILHPPHLHPIFACKARFTYTTKQQQAARKICQRLECSIHMVWAMLSTVRSMQKLHWQTYEQPASPFRDEPAWSLGAWSHRTMHHARLDSPSSMQSAIHRVLKSWSSSWQVWTFFSFQSSFGILLLNLFIFFKPISSQIWNHHFVVPHRAFLSQ